MPETTTLLAEPARSAPARRGPDPDAEAFRAELATLHGEAQRHVGHIFAWLDRCLETGDQRGGIDVVLALADLDTGSPLSHVLMDLLSQADRRMPCPGGDDPLCECALCAYGRSGATVAAGVRVKVQ